MTLSDRIAAVQDRVKWRNGRVDPRPPGLLVWRLTDGTFELSEEPTYHLERPGGGTPWAPLTEVLDALEAVAVEREMAEYRSNPVLYAVRRSTGGFPVRAPEPPEGSE